MSSPRAKEFENEAMPRSDVDRREAPALGHGGRSVFEPIYERVCVSFVIVVTVVSTHSS